ncbi:MAG: carboxypeptidase M32, partial [Lachnospiraceae bacterium]|nr:carboxypeptidase M32 [Lachnospiraceae bacterium]
GFDFEHGILAESAHPFTTNLHNADVRITNHFYENNLESAIFSVIHEGGHALYELGVDDELTLTPVGGGTSMGVHESQSRFYENVLGRSEAFWKPLFPKLKETWPEQLADVGLSDFILGINKAEPGPIRTEADELTYPLHIMIRYEIEKQLISGEIEIDELPGIWNEKYREYLGVTPKNDREGVLQDVHWSGGSFGYFPSYAIGNAVAAQIYSFMHREIKVGECLENSDLAPIREYLRKHIHRYGSTKNMNELLSEMTGEQLNVDYYIDYLTEKYTKLYLQQ